MAITTNMPMSDAELAGIVREAFLQHVASKLEEQAMEIIKPRLKEACRSAVEELETTINSLRSFVDARTVVKIILEDRTITDNGKAP